jgi:enoyl-[acyl-carrier protein] reductase I
MRAWINSPQRTSTPIGELVDIDDVGLTTAFLTTPFARRLTGTTVYVDGGLNVMA